MKKIILWSLLAISSLTTMTSCEDEDSTMRFVTWKGFKIDKTRLAAGDTLRIHAEVDQPGKYLYKVAYKWTMVIDTVSQENVVRPDTITYRIQSTSTRPIHMNDEPKAHFVIPKNAVKGTKSRNFSFTCDYEHAAAGIPAPQKETTPYEGYLGGVFSYNVLSQLYSRSQNSFATNITIE